MRKFIRAVKQLQDEKKEVTEEAVKELYVKWGGLVVEKEEIVEETPRRGRKPKVEVEEVEEEVQNTVEEE